MKYVAAYMLLALAGNGEPTKDEVKSLLEGAGVQVDENELAFVIEKLGDKSLADLEELGKGRLVSISQGGAARNTDSATNSKSNGGIENDQDDDSESSVSDVGGDGLFGADDGY